MRVEFSASPNRLLGVYEFGFDDVLEAFKKVTNPEDFGYSGSLRHKLMFGAFLIAEADGFKKPADDYWAEALESEAAWAWGALKTGTMYKGGAVTVIGDVEGPERNEHPPIETPVQLFSYFMYSGPVLDRLLSPRHRVKDDRAADEAIA